MIGTTAGDTLITRNPYLYRGYRYDRETGLYYLNSRYYDPETGRFINADVFVSTGQGVLGNNMFAYCLNIPVSGIDNEGTSALSFFWYVLFVISDYGFVHRAVQAHIASNPTVMTECWVQRIDESKGKADVIQMGLVWEVKHKVSAIFAKPQAESYVGATLSRDGSVITGLGLAGTFEETFDINLFDKSFTVTYWTPDNGVILYDVKYNPEYNPAPFRVIQTENYKERVKSTVTAIGTVGFSFGFGYALGGGYHTDRFIALQVH